LEQHDRDFLAQGLNGKQSVKYTVTAAACLYIKGESRLDYERIRSVLFKLKGEKISAYVLEWNRIDFTAKLSLLRFIYIFVIVLQILSNLEVRHV
jgi:hypothetical protein